MKPLQWNKEANVNDLIQVLANYGIRNGYKTVKAGPGVLELQRTSTARLVTGLSNGVRIVITTALGATTVQFGEVGKNVGLKGAAALVAGAVFWPVAALPAYGAYQQYQFLEGIRAEVNDYFNSLEDD